jgi:hypothetical protein
MLDETTISIFNFNRFNGRKDIGSTTWLRLQNSLFEDPDFFSFSHSELCFWVYLLCNASRKNSSKVVLNFAHCKLIGRFKMQEISTAIEKLIKIKCIEICSDVTPGVTPDVTPIRDAMRDSTEGRKNEKTSSPTMNFCVFDFDVIWKSYPRKVNKSEGRERFNRLIKSTSDFDQLIIAVENYASHCKKLNLEEKHVRHFSTFLGKEKAENWRDWIEGVQSNSGGAPAWCKFEDPNADWSND